MGLEMIPNLFNLLVSDMAFWNCILSQGSRDSDHDRIMVYNLEYNVADDTAA
jgi:hypothetical protein